jgi:hypothetical protein
MKIITVGLLFAVPSFVAQAQNGDFHLDKEYSIDRNGLIELSASDARVFITGTTRSTARVKIDRKITSKGWTYGEDYFEAQVEEKRGGIRIYEKKKRRSVGVIGYYNEEYRIDIEAPEGISLVVKGDDGDYYLKNINGSISLSLDDADVELSDCKGDKFSFLIDDGDITMDNGRGSLEIRGDDSDIKIYNAHFTSIQARVDDGDLIIETSLSDDGNYVLESEDGSLAINITGGGGEFDIRHDDARVITQGSFKKLEDDEHRTKLSLANGSAKVSVRVDDGRVKLTAR